MITGKGVLILRYAGRIDVEYQFGGVYDDTRSGYLLCDVSKIDPAAFGERLTLICDDGCEVLVAVMNVSDRHLGVIGRVLPARDRVA